MEAMDAGIDSRSPYGERGLKFFWTVRLRRMIVSRSPYGERGLKFVGVGRLHADALSLSLRRAWIEMGTVGMGSSGSVSLSLRRAWIEIQHDSQRGVAGIVALLTESVD